MMYDCNKPRGYGLYFQRRRHCYSGELNTGIPDHMILKNSIAGILSYILAICCACWLSLNLFLSDGQVPDLSIKSETLVDYP